MNLSSPLTLLFNRKTLSFYYKEESRAKKTAFGAKGRLYTTGKVIPRLFIIDLHTQLAIYGYR